MTPPTETPPTVTLRPPRHQVSPRAIPYWTTRAAAGWLPLLVPALVVTLVLPDRPGWLPWALAGAALVALVHILVMPQWRYRVHRWEVTPDAVYTQAGWLDQERRIAPVSRIQTVDTERGPLEQLFGLARVTVTTASAAGPLEIHGLDHTTALRMADELTTTTQATPGDAT
ncbi:MAG TPA: PH domain-containing protein [Mycobacteriales bacterium]|jgi:membrane protein YdbS with pleckstrin-like domain|nr:PH domain-containing protein [Mycobacteriales bacterium]